MNRLNLIYHPTTHNATFSDTCVDSSFTDEENASGFFNSKAQRERFAEYHDFPISHSSKQDSESGYHYFGARYYDSELLTGWLSVDPMADKYPSISPYAYCAWTRPTGGDEHRWIKYNTVNNPMIFVDPDGQEKIISFNINSSNKEKKGESRTLTRAAKHYTRNRGVIHLFAHGWVPEGQERCYGINTYGDRDDVKRLRNPRQLHTFLKENSAIYRRNNKDGETSNTSILVLHSCQTGEEGAIAQQASKELNLLVIAPSENITSKEVKYFNGRIEYSEYVSDNGVWNIYYKGELMESFNGNTKPLFDNPQKTIEKYEIMYNERHSQASGE